jgi:hypothetical protein
MDIERNNTVQVAVTDMRLGGSFEFEVHPAEALAAFHHPYAYAARDQAAHTLAA